jgi:hypothetical protein
VKRFNETDFTCAASGGEAFRERRHLQDKEHIMFALLSHLIGKLVSSSDVPSNRAYLGSSSDMADLERRMRQAEYDDRAYSMAFCGSVSRDRNAFAQ